MTTTNKAIRSSGWLTDFLIGFPDGLFLLFFSTQLLQSFPLEVQTFYNIHLGIWGIGSLLVMYSAFRANRGDSQHDEFQLSPQERLKLEKLDIAPHTISHIEQEMAKDGELWENILEKEQVKETSFSLARAIRSALATAIFFLMGGALSFGPYLANESFPAAGQTSMLLVFLGLTFFSFVKARVTSQRTLPLVVRYLTMGLGILIGVWILRWAMQ